MYYRFGTTSLGECVGFLVWKNNNNYYYQGLVSGSNEYYKYFIDSVKMLLNIDVLSYFFKNQTEIIENDIIKEGGLLVSDDQNILIHIRLSSNINLIYKYLESDMYYSVQKDKRANWIRLLDRFATDITQGLNSP